MGEQDPTAAARNKLLDLWIGKDSGFVSRFECQEVAGLCEK